MNFSILRVENIRMLNIVKWVRKNMLKKKNNVKKVKKTYSNPPIEIFQRGILSISKN